MNVVRSHLCLYYLIPFQPYTSRKNFLILCFVFSVEFLAGILVQTRHDICSSTLYVLNSYCHSSSEYPFYYSSAVIRPLFYLTKRSSFFQCNAKAFTEPPAKAEIFFIQKNKHGIPENLRHTVFVWVY